MRTGPVAPALLFGALFGLAFACSSGSGGQGPVAAGDDASVGGDTGNPPLPDGASATDSADAADGPLAMLDSPADGPPPYPGGPYGINVGDVLQNLSWDGYVNTKGTVVSTSLPYGPTSLQDLRGGGHGFAMIHLSDFY